MTIETKHNIGDKIFLLYKNEVQVHEVTKVIVECTGKIPSGVHVEIYYRTNKSPAPEPEIKCYKTKEALLQSL